jgi:hypothetical protein
MNAAHEKSKALAVPTWIFRQILGSVGNKARDVTGLDARILKPTVKQLDWFLTGLTVALAGNLVEPLPKDELLRGTSQESIGFDS